MAENKRDYYEVLGVGKDAGAEEIKKAYRQLSRKYTRDEAYIQKEIDSFGHELLVFYLEPEQITGKITKES